jgi:hypothetical protein
MATETDTKSPAAGSAPDVVHDLLASVRSYFARYKSPDVVEIGPKFGEGQHFVKVANQPDRVTQSFTSRFPEPAAYDFNNMLLSADNEAFVLQYSW